MQVDEALGKITDLEVRAFFQKMVSEQNSYATKLEAQNKALAAQVEELKSKSSNTGAPNGAGVDNITARYLEKNMRRDVIAEAEAIVKSKIDEARFNAVKQDWIAFLDKAMTKDKTTVEFATDAFDLVLGQCIMKADHPVNQIGKTTPSPSGTPNPAVNPGTNANSVKDVNDILAKQPPVMTGADSGAQPGIPTPGANQIKNTKDAFAALQSKFGRTGGNRFQ